MNTPSPRHVAQAQPLDSSSKARPGQMTAVMRSLAIANGPRIPRVAVVRDGRILDEHLVRDASSVTIGTSERALIVVRNAPQLPPSFELLERVGNRYFLKFTDAMTGRVTGPSGIASLQDLRSIAQASNGAYRIPLSEDARGKVVVGDTTFLFQMVVRPPASPRPQLPLSVKNNIGLDWSLTIIVAFSFLIHFGIAGAMYSDWLDPVVTADYAVSGLIDDLSRLPKPLPEPIPLQNEPGTSEPVKTPVVANNTTTTPVKNNTTNTTSHTTTTTNNAQTQSQADRNAASLIAQAEKLEIDQLTVKANGSSVQKALDRSAIPAVDMSAAAERNIAVTHEQGDLRVKNTGGPIGPSKSSGLPGVLADNTKKTGNDKAGTDNGPAGPQIIVGTEPPRMNGVISDADSVVAKLRPRFRKCYQDGLLNDPNMSGKAVLSLKIAPNGEVQSSSIESNEGLSSGVTGCLQKAVNNAQFTGNGAMTTMRIPVSMIKQTQQR